MVYTTRWISHGGQNGSVVGCQLERFKRADAGGLRMRSIGALIAWTAILTVPLAMVGTLKTDNVDDAYRLAQLSDRESSMAANEAPQAKKPVEFFVSPQGNDAWSGKFPDPTGNDGPFATIERARDAVRALPRANDEPQSVRVVLRRGTWFLNKPLEFGPEDSGLPYGRMGEGKYAVTYTAAPGEKVRISGGRRLDSGHWGNVNGRKAWVVDIPEVKQGQWTFHQLFVNGERRPRTRLPKEGGYRIESVPDAVAGREHDVDTDRRFVYAGTDIQPWHHLQDVELVVAATCVASRMFIHAVDVEKRLVTFDRTSRGPVMYGGRPIYWVENVFEALDTPGQWYLDRALGRLYILPKEGEDLATAEIIAPRLTYLVRITGKKDAPARFIHFQGITFSHTEWHEPPDWPREGTYTGAWYDIPGAISLTHAFRCAVTHCVIEHASPYAIEVREGCSDTRIAANRMTDLGAGGVKLWFGSARSMVADNEISHTGLIFLTSYGICVSDSAGNFVAYNHIYDRHYTGILVGWLMEFQPSNAFGNVVEHNHVHDIGKGIMSDMGGIYTEGVCGGSRIRYNVVHDIRARLGDNNGIYLDSGADILVEKNLSYRCQPLHVHFTRNITFENNIFALGEIQVTNAGTFQVPLDEYQFRRNIVYFNQGRVFGRWNPENRNVTADHNLYWSTSSQPLLFGTKTLAEWQAAGKDPHCVVADPLFMDPEHGDFRLRPGSPAAKIGFEPWDLSDIGPREPPGAW